MIIIKLSGGLGNQMFQYAFGRAFSVKNSIEFKLDISGYPKQTLRQYKLNNFNIIENLATEEDLKKIKNPYGILSKIKRVIWDQKILRQFHVGYEPELFKKQDETYFDGFFQNERYFIDIQEIIRKEFTLKYPMGESAKKSLELIQQSPTPISFHVRRGDYVLDEKTKKYHGGCSEEYYANALKLIKEGVENNISVFVFSDDIEWVKKNIKINARTFYVSNDTIQDFEEIMLMSKCHHHIIANSSFSWWGAWLNNRSDKKVIAPKVWLARSKDKEHNNVVPNHWIRIPN